MALRFAGHGIYGAHAQVVRQDSPARPMVTIAFVCVENAGRSQMAAAFARALAPHGVTILSGGTRPARRLHPVVVETLLEVGIDLSRDRPRAIGPADVADCDVVVTMGCSEEDVCPAHFRGDARDWTLPDPKGRTREEVRGIRDEIERRVRRLLLETTAGEGSGSRPRRPLAPVRQEARRPARPQKRRARRA